MNKSQFEVSILVNQKSIREYSHQGNIFIEGKEGSNYSIKIKNNSPGRIMVVASVDGLNVLNGKKCSTIDDIGYILNGHSAYSIDGFRISDNEVAAFKFAKKDKSYLKDSSGDSNGVGIIGVAIWEEKDNKFEKLKKELEELKNQKEKIVEKHYPYYPNWPWYPYRRPYYDYYRPYEIWCSSASTMGQGALHGNSLNSLSSSISNNCGGAELRASYSSQVVESQNVADFDLGTEWGDSVSSKITTTEFEKGNLVESFEILYASREMLINMGIDIDNKPKINIPKAFPKDEGIYCRPPSGWKGAATINK